MRGTERAGSSEDLARLPEAERSRIREQRRRERDRERSRAGSTGGGGTPPGRRTSSDGASVSGSEAGSGSVSASSAGGAHMEDSLNSVSSVCCLTPVVAPSADRGLLLQLQDVHLRAASPAAAASPRCQAMLACGRCPSRWAAPAAVGCARAQHCKSMAAAHWTAHIAAAGAAAHAMVRMTAAPQQCRLPRCLRSSCRHWPLSTRIWRWTSEILRRSIFRLVLVPPLPAHCHTSITHDTVTCGSC